MLDAVYRFFMAIGYHHPIHPTEVHMPIGLVVGALAFSLVALGLRRPYLAQVSRYCFLLAFLFMFPTIIFGIMDWQYYYNGFWLHEIKMKMILSGISAGFLLFVLSKVTEDMSKSELLSPVAAAWIPVAIGSLTGFVALLYQEDG